MKPSWIENYAGTWFDKEGRTLVIKVLSDIRASVEILIDGNLMILPWNSNKPAKDLKATYNPIDGPSLEIELGRDGFCLELNYEFGDSMFPNEPESLSVGISRYESDKDVEKYYKLFGKLERYLRSGQTNT